VRLCLQYLFGTARAVVFESTLSLLPLSNCGSVLWCNVGLHQMDYTDDQQPRWQGKEGWDVLGHLPSYLRKEVLCHVNRSIMDKVPVFRDFGNEGRWLTPLPPPPARCLLLVSLRCALLCHALLTAT
jgi:hypothetical protein